MELVPALASVYGLRVTLGIWINEWEAQNEKEIERAIALSKRYRNIDSLIVGNETIFRERLTRSCRHKIRRQCAVQDLIAKIQRVKRNTSVPVSTAEVYNIWLEHPELASSVDYLAVHILPFWEGMPGSAAVDHAIGAYQKLREAYPGKRIVIAEFGWPSAGLNRKDAVPSPIPRPRSCAISSPAPTRWASTIRLSKPSISRGRPTKAASAPIGASSTPTETRNSPSPAR